MKYRIGAVYFAALGVIISFFGAVDIVLSVSGRELLTDYLVASGSMWALWKGFILFFAGVFILFGGIKLSDVHGLGKVVLGFFMLWIVSGCNIFARVTESIPGEESWFNSLEGFLASYGSPYELELWVLPFSLVVLYFVKESRSRNLE